MRPRTAAVIAAVHVYLAAGHLWELFAGDVQWTHCWKGFGALAGAYVFAAIASRGLARGGGRRKVAAGTGAGSFSTGSARRAERLTR
jgi:hypothetical protein